MIEEKKEFEDLCKRYECGFIYDIHKPFYVLCLILESNDEDLKQTIPYNNYFKKSLFNNNTWL